MPHLAPPKNQAVGRKGWALAALMAATCASVVVSLNAWGAARAERQAHGADAPPMAEGHGPMGHGMPFEGRYLDKMLDLVKATDAQRAQVRQIADKARTDLQALHAPASAPGKDPKDGKDEAGGPPHGPGGPGGPGGLMALLSQPKIDVAAAEQARQQMMARHDAVSKRMLQATIDIANVLTPEQRATLAQEMQKRHDARRGPGHGMGPREDGRQPEAH